MDTERINGRTPTQGDLKSNSSKPMTQKASAKVEMQPQQDGFFITEDLNQ